jgi:phosphoesterase RecJ-like protein
MNELARVLTHLRSGQRFIVSSHQRPDGDAVGSAMAMALALRELGKQADVVFDAALPHYLQPFPRTQEITITRNVDAAYDAAVIMECSSLDRTGVSGLDRSPVINIDHHVGNTGYGLVNWVDESAAACGELVFALVEALDVPLTPEIATHVYLAVLTDTGSFRFSHLSPRTYAIAGRCVEAGADPQWIARTHYDSSTLARVRIFGAVLNGMQLDPSNRVASLALTLDTLAATGGTYDDTDGIINFPLSVKTIEAVAFFKEVAPGDWRVSMRSKGAVDVGGIARAHGGGGHVNAAGCSAKGDLATLQPAFQQWMVAKTDEAAQRATTAS